MKHVNQAKNALKIANYKVCMTSKMVVISTKKPEDITKVPLPYIKNYIGQ
jgi:ribosomal protein L16/L10AE